MKRCGVGPKTQPVIRSIVSRYMVSRGLKMSTLSQFKALNGLKSEQKLLIHSHVMKYLMHH